jgi:hypothetical protein
MAGWWNQIKDGKLFTKRELEIRETKKQPTSIHSSSTKTKKKSIFKLLAGLLLLNGWC